VTFSRLHFSYCLWSTPCRYTSKIHIMIKHAFAGYVYTHTNYVGSEKERVSTRFFAWVTGSPGEGNGNPLQYPCLENPMDRGAWQATVHGVRRVGHDLTTKPPTLKIIF
ncbi:hypothetical protein FD754_019348, partial [Muntiacus muntjak]